MWSLAFERGLTERKGHLLYWLIGITVLISGCASVKQQGLVDRMTPERPAWLKEPASVCPPSYRCALAEGRGSELSGATAAAKGKAVSSLISEVAVEITSLLEVHDVTRTQGDVVKEKSRIIQRVASRVRGHLTDTRTVSNYWEKSIRHSAKGSRLEYESYVVVGVPTSTLAKMRREAHATKQSLEEEVELFRGQFYGTMLRNLSDSLGELLSGIKGYRSRADALVIASPIVLETLAETISASIV